MKINARKIASLVIVCGCFAMADRASLAQSPQAQVSAPTVHFNHPSCLSQGIASWKLGYNGVPSSAGSVWWYVVVNFNESTSVGESQHIHSCIRVGNEAGEKIAKLGNCETEGDVQIRRGVAYFNGGYIECEAFNIGAAGEEIGILVKGPTKFAERFWVAFKGNLSDTVTSTVPLLRYEPVDPNTEFPGTIAFNLTPASEAQPQGFVASETPFGNLQGSGLTLAVQPTSGFMGLFEAVPAHGDPSKLIYGWSLFRSGLTDAMSVEASFTPVGIGESKLYIGGLPTGERFFGTLDFVVFDPVGGGRGGG